MAQLLFRMYHVKSSSIFLIGALILFLLVPFFSYFSLINLPLSFVYMSTALTHVLVLLLSNYFLKEVISMKQRIAISIIIVGIIMFNV